MTNSVEQLLNTVAESRVETIRIVFADQHGITRGKTIMASGLESALRSGVSMTSTLLLKDTSHATVFPVWADDAGFGKGVMTGASDFLMKPDLDTFRILPWTGSDGEAGTGWLLSDICHNDGRPINLSTRGILKDAVDALRQQSLEFRCGLEVEFYVLKLEDPKLGHEHSAMPQDPPQTSLLAHGYQYLTENRIDELDEVMRLIRNNAISVGLPLRTMESEFGPSQFEVTFDPMSALEAADSLVLFRNMVKQMCRRHGYHATFMCRPGFKNSMGSGWHLHQSLTNMKTGANAFAPSKSGQMSETCSAWIAGLLKHAAESIILSTPTINGYKRYQPYALAPDRIQWGHDNRGAMLRYLDGNGPETCRIENRVGEPAANPYLYIASQIICGLAGLEQNLNAPEPVEQPYQNDSDLLPNNLHTAMEAFGQSALFRQVLGDKFVDYYLQIKQAEWKRYLGAVSEWEHREYFSLF